MTAAALPAAPAERPIQQARHAWELLYLLTRRDLKLRYQDTALGFVWTAMKPLLFALVVWFAMSKVVRFQVDMPYHLFLLSALLPWTLFQTSVMVSTPLIVNNGSLIKKIPFPVFVLPLAVIANNTIHFALSLPVLVAFLLLDGRVPGPEWIVGVPFLLLLQLGLMMGLALALSALDEIQRLASKPDIAPGPTYLVRPEVRELVIREVRATYNPSQRGLEGIADSPDIEAIVDKTTELVVQRTIAIPRIMVVPQGEVKTGFHLFKLDLANVRFQPPEQSLWLHYLRTNQSETIGFGGSGIEEPRPENYIVRRLIEFDDVAYDTCADVLYDLASQMVAHLRSYLTEDQAVQVLRYHEREIGNLIHAQMEAHYWEDATDYEVKVSRGFTELKPTAFSQTGEVLDFRISPADKGNMARYLFGGFQRSLYPVAKFQSDPERVLAVILERDSIKWFRPVAGQFQLFYKFGGRVLEYQPDFVAETGDAIYMLEPKRASDMNDAEVLAKRDAAVLWCQRASYHASQCGEKPWSYALIPHDAIATNMSLDGLVQRWRVQ